MWDGRFANNGWLQEAPKPLTKLTWDTAAWISPRLAEEKSLDRGDIIELRYRGVTARMPVFIVPGQPDQSVTVFSVTAAAWPDASAPRARNQAFNAYRLRTSDAPWFGTGLEIVDRRSVSARDDPGSPRHGRPASCAWSRSRSTHEPTVVRT